MKLRFPKVLDGMTWRLLAGNAAVTIVLGAWFGFTTDPAKVLQAIAGISALLAAATYYTHDRPDPTLAAACCVFAFLLLFPAIALPMSYITAAFGMPVQDALLSRMDRALGFDWLALQKATFANTWLREASFFAYTHAHWPILGGWVALILTGQFERIRQFALLTIATLTIGLALAALFPVAGAYAYYGISTEAMAGLRGTGAGSWHIADFNAVRAGTLRVIAYDHLQGIVQFPSFHTVGALTAAWATWRTPYLKWPLLLANAFIVFTSLPVGGHFLMDVIGGVALTGGVLALMQNKQAGTDKVALPPALASAFHWMPSAEAR